MFNWKEVKKIADKFDFIYFDLKCMNSDIHKSVTGSPKRENTKQPEEPCTNKQ